MSAEQYANLASSNTTQSQLSSDTTLTLNSASTFPLVPQFRIRNNTTGELMLVTAINASTFTVTRGIEGTTAVAITQNDQIVQVVTKASLQQTHIALKPAWTNITCGQSSYQILDTDGRIACDSSTGPITLIVPPSPIDGQTIEIADVGGKAGTYAIGINGTSATNGIAGKTFYFLTDAYGKAEIVWNAAKSVWVVFDVTRPVRQDDYYGDFAGLPAAGQKGRKANGPNFCSLWVDDGTQWDPVINGVQCVQPPLASTFSAINSGGQTLQDANGTLFYSAVNDTTANVVMRGFGFSNSSKYAYAECLLEFVQYADGASRGVAAGAVLYESATGKALSIEVSHATGASVTVQVKVWSSTTAATSTVYDLPVTGNTPLLLRVRRDVVSVYADIARATRSTAVGQPFWINLQSASIAATYTTAPDTAGFTGRCAGATGQVVVLHFVQGILNAAPVAAAHAWTSQNVMGSVLAPLPVAPRIGNVMGSAGARPVIRAA